MSPRLSLCLAAALGCLLGACDQQDKKSRLSPEDQLEELGVMPTDYESQLLCESSGGTVKVIRLLIKAGVNVNTVDTDGRTPLHIAAAAGRARIIRVLLANGATMDALDKANHTPLDLAILQKQEKSIRVLKAAGGKATVSEAPAIVSEPPAFVSNSTPKPAVWQAEPDKASKPAPATTYSTANPLHEAASLGNLTQARQLLCQNPALINQPDDQGNTPLMKAVANKHAAMVSLLISKEANPHLRNAEGKTAMALAVSQNHYPTTQALIVGGAQEQQQASIHQSHPLIIACTSHKEDEVRRLSASGADLQVTDKRGWTLLHHAARFGNTNIVKQLLDAGLNPNAGDMDQWTPLHAAIWLQNEEIIKLLVERGANVNAQDRFGRTPLIDAARKGHGRLVSLLIGLDANIHLQDKENKTALSWAYQRKDSSIVSEINQAGFSTAANLKNQKADELIQSCVLNDTERVRELLAAGARVNARYADDWTPLHYAARFGNHAIVQLLIQAGADVNAKDKDLWTPLHATTRQRKTEAARVLVAAGANVHATDKFKRTPLHDAARRNAYDIVRLLLSEGAGTTGRDTTGRTPLDWAERFSCIESIHLLSNH